MGQIISISNHKGGVGKTTTALNIAAALAMKEYDVLLIDMDAQSNLTDTLGITGEQPNMYEILKGTAKAKPVKVKEHLDAIPATLELAAAEMELSTAIGREQLLKEAIEPLRGHYDFIIIDTAPTLGLLTINAMAAADAVVIPMQPEYYALKGVKRLAEIIDSVKRRVNPRLRIGGFIITQFDTRTILHRQIQEAVKTQFVGLIFPTLVHNSIAIAEAQVKHSTIFDYAPDSAVAEDYANVAEEFARRFQ